MYSTEDSQYLRNDQKENKTKKTQKTTENIVETRLKIKDPVSGHSLVRFQSNQH